MYELFIQYYGKNSKCYYCSKEKRCFVEVIYDYDVWFNSVDVKILLNMYLNKGGCK